MPSSASASSGCWALPFSARANWHRASISRSRSNCGTSANVALGIVKEEHAAAQKGGVSDADAQKRAMARIAALRYGNNDYYWINDMHPKMVMHPIKPEMNGNDLSAYKDPNGKLLFVDFVDDRQKERLRLRSL